jgi:uncharacterized protein Usg
MSENYREFIKWLQSYPVTAEEISETMPEHYQKLRNAIEAMDLAYYNENLHAFNENLEKVKNLYLHAVCVISNPFLCWNDLEYVWNVEKK